MGKLGIVLGSARSRFMGVWPRGSGFFCSLCGKGYGRFLPAGQPARANALCPGCHSLERHRLLRSLLGKLWDEGVSPHGGRMLLHAAPERALAHLFSPDFDYVSIDLDGNQAMKAMDITALEFDDDSFDAVVCNHVLEHVQDDWRAMSELYRVMKPAGWGGIQVPMRGNITQEDLSITDPEERRRLYGQDDHVRQYGRDFLERLREAGFEVSEYRKEDWLSPGELARLSVDCEDSVILVRRLG